MHINQAFKIINQCIDKLLATPSLDNGIPIGGIAILAAHERCAPPYQTNGGIWDRHMRVLTSGRIGCEFIDESWIAEQADPNLRSPTYEQTTTHATWMAGQLRGMEHDGKRMRWLGFIDGVVSCHSLLTVDIQGAGVFGWVFYRLTNDAYKPIFKKRMLDEFRSIGINGGVMPLEYALGYMQGFLWCAGVYTINELRKMNDPKQI